MGIGTEAKVLPWWLSISYGSMKYSCDNYPKKGRVIIIWANSEESDITLYTVRLRYVSMFCLQIDKNSQTKSNFLLKKFDPDCTEK